VLLSPVTIALNDAPFPAVNEADVGVIETLPWVAARDWLPTSEMLALAVRLGLVRVVAVTVTVCEDKIVLGAW